MIKQQMPSVMVVDYERVIAETLTVILNGNGFTANFYTDPHEALRYAKTKPPDLLISDIMMPQLSGIHLALKMRAQHPDCKILLFSGQINTADLLIPARARGHAFHVLLKPVHPSDLLRKMRGQESLRPVENLAAFPTASRSASRLSMSRYRPQESDPTKKSPQQEVAQTARPTGPRVSHGKL